MLDTLTFRRSRWPSRPSSLTTAPKPCASPPNCDCLRASSKCRYVPSATSASCPRGKAPGAASSLRSASQRRFHAGARQLGAMRARVLRMIRYLLDTNIVHLRDQASPTRSAALHIQGRTALWIHPCRVEDTRAVHRSQRPTHCSPCAQRRACDSDEQPQKIRTRTRPADRKLDRATVLIIFSFINLMSKLCDPQILLSPCSCRPSRTDQARIHSPSLQSIGQLRR